MKLAIIAIGKSKKGAETSLIEGWTARMAHFTRITEFDSPLPAGPKRTKDESARMLDWFDRQPGTPKRLVCLDPTGQDIASDRLAAMIGDWRDAGTAACYFALGGADGHHAGLRDKSDAVIAFGRATWPHMLCRVMLAEQLYRAEMILAGHPYHRS